MKLDYTILAERVDEFPPLRRIISDDKIIFKEIYESEGDGHEDVLARGECLRGRGRRHGECFYCGRGVENQRGRVLQEHPPRGQGARRGELRRHQGAGRDELPCA